MITRFVRGQLVAFVVVTVLGVSFALISYVHLPQILGFGQYETTIALPSNGQLYANAIVTLRGAQIGKVKRVRLTPDGAAADLSIDNGTRIPMDSTAQVRVTSAIGEQYVNFVPRDSRPPYLGSGDVLPASHVTLPTPINDVLDHASQLATSVPLDKLTTTINEAYDAFNNTSGDLQRLLDSFGPLLGDAQAHIGQTKSLINDLQPVLATQRNVSPQITSFAHNLASFTEQLRMSDADIRSTLDQGPNFARSTNRLVNQLWPTVPTLLANLTSVGQVLNVYIPSLTHTLSILPATINELSSAVYGSPIPGSALLDFKVALNDPPACTVGFTGGPERDPADTSLGSVPENSYCKVPSNSSIDVRGMHNSQCPNNPRLRSATAAGCGLNFQGPLTGASAKAEIPSAGPATYNPSTGLLFSPDGQTYKLGASALGNPARSWQEMLLSPLDN